MRISDWSSDVCSSDLDLVRNLGRSLGSGLDELTITTNGNQLAKHAEALAEAGVRRINVSLDTLRADRFRQITRWGRSEERRVGKEWVSPGRSRCAPCH